MKFEHDPTVPMGLYEWREIQTRPERELYGRLFREAMEAHNKRKEEAEMNKKEHDETYFDLVKGQIASLHEELEEKDWRLKEKDKEIKLLRSWAHGVETETVKFYKSQREVTNTLWKIRANIIEDKVHRKMLANFASDAVAHMEMKHGNSAAELEDVWLEVRVNMNKAHATSWGDYYYRRAKVKLLEEDYKKEGGDNE